MRFLVDTQLPIDLSQLLVRHLHEAEHVLEVGLAQGKDNALWDYAARHQAIIVSKDEDFADWIARGRSGPSVVWLRIGNCSNERLLIWFESLLPQIIERLKQGERLVEVR